MQYEAPHTQYGNALEEYHGPSSRNLEGKFQEDGSPSHLMFFLLLQSAREHWIFLSFGSVIFAPVKVTFYSW